MVVLFAISIIFTIVSKNYKVIKLETEVFQLRITK